MTKKKNEVAPLDESGDVTTYTAPKGFEDGVDPEDLIVPRVKLMQALSPEMSEGLGLSVGDCINSLTKEKIEGGFIPIFMTKNYIRFNPRKKEELHFDPAYNPGEMIWRTSDSNDIRVKEQCQFGSNGEKPAATTFLNFFCRFKGQDMPVILSFSNTSYKAGKHLLSLCKFAGGDMFSRKYKLLAAMESRNQDTFAVLKVIMDGIPPKEEIEECNALWESFSPQKGDITVHEAEEDRPY